MRKEEAVVYWPVLGGALFVLAVSLLATAGYLTVARRWLSEAWERHQEDHRNWLNDQRRNDVHKQAALIPGGSYVEEGGR